MYVNASACKSMQAHLFTYTHHWLAQFFPLPADLRFLQLFMSHLFGQVLCQMCVKQDLICPHVRLLIVCSSGC